jgi:hypothetical protein
LARIYRNNFEHDPADMNRARELASNPDITPVGVLYRNEQVPCYEDLRRLGQSFTPAMIGQALDKEFDKFTVQPQCNGDAALDELELEAGDVRGLSDLPVTASGDEHR